MRIRTRIALGILMLVGLGFYFLIDLIGEDIKPQYREATEEPLVDTARVLASFASMSAKKGKINVELFRSAFLDASSRSFNAQIYDLLKNNVDLRVYITNEKGIVLFDSDGGHDEGVDYSGWRDVSRTLAGEYGARTTKSEAHPETSILYIAAPIVVNDKIIGVLTVGKPTLNSLKFMEAAQRKLIVAGTVTCITLIVLGLFLTFMITSPVQKLTDYARDIRDGRRVKLPVLGSGDMGELGAAFEEMRESLEGKQYVEHYVQTLTHEMKSPLAAIQGAAELLHEEMPSERRDKFLENIRGEADRMMTIVEKMLLLSSLENRKVIEEVEVLQIGAIVREVVDSLSPLVDAKELKLSVDGDDRCAFKGEAFLVRQALANVLQNAIEFSPQKGEIKINFVREGSEVVVTVRDFGPGIPGYAQARIFERFYSLKRSDTGKKSSGLGLTLVKEVMALHAGTVTLSNAPEGGCIARLTFPLGH